VKALDEEPCLTVSVLTTNSSKSTIPSHIKVHKIDDSYPENELLQAFEGQDVVVSTAGFAGILQQMPLIDAAVKAGVRRFLPAEFGGDKATQKLLKLYPFSVTRTRSWHI